jgi:hypothetical protein
LEREAQPVRGVPQAFHLLREGEAIGIGVGQVVDDHRPPAGLEHSSRLLEQADRNRDVMEREPADEPVVGVRVCLETRDVADLEAEVALVVSCGLSLSESDHRGRGIDAIDLGGERSQPAGDDPGPAGCLQPALVAGGTGQLDDLVKELVGVGHGRTVEALGLARERLGHGAVVHVIKVTLPQVPRVGST